MYADSAISAPLTRSGDSPPHQAQNLAWCLPTAHPQTIKATPDYGLVTAIFVPRQTAVSVSGLSVAGDTLRRGSPIRGAYRGGGYGKEAAVMAMPQITWTQSAETELADLEALWQRLDIPGHRVELVGVQIVVSPTASARHSTIVYELTDALINLARRHGWVIHSNLAVHIAATRERLIPDLMVAPRDAPRFSDSELRSHGVLLVAEVVSPSSQRQDRVVK